jgi:hypothetical protein
MKKELYFLTCLSLVFSFLALVVQPGNVQAAAGTPTPVNTLLIKTPVPPQATPGALASAEKKTFTFKELGYQEKLLVGPFSTVTVKYSIPENWKLVPGGVISLRFTMTVSNSGNGTNMPDRIHGTLLVMMNNKTIETIFLDKVGEYNLNIPVTDLEALEPLNLNGEHELRLILDSSISCNYGDVQTTVLINPVSSMTFEHQETSPMIDLSVFPRPIYQPNSIFATQMMIVIPDNPTAANLQGVMDLITGLGSQTEGKLVLSIKTAKDLTDTDKKSNNLLFIGPLSSFPMLNTLTWPLPVKDGSFALGDKHKDDGVILMALSPWNSSKVAMLVTANSDADVKKAAQAASTGRIITSGRPDVSLVAEVNPEKKSFPFVQDQTFSDLGYQTQTFNQMGENYALLKFYISPEQAATSEAYIDLVTSHSQLLNLDGTSVTVLLNNEIISGESFAKDTEQVKTTHIKILPSLLRPGENLLEISANLVPYYSCYSVDTTSAWITISNTSLIHIPVATENESKIKFAKTLKDYPEFYFADPTFENLSMVLARNDFTSVEAAARIAYYLGASSNSSFANLSVVFADAVTDDILKKDSLIVIGRASTLPILSKFNKDLPAPFDTSTDQAKQDVMLVNYSLPEGVNVGYIQLLKSPWNEDNMIITVTGNTQLGIPMAAKAMDNDVMSVQLTGNFAIISGTQILSTNTDLGSSREALAGGVPNSVTVTPTSGGYAAGVIPDVKGQPAWLLPAFFGSSIILVLLFVILIIRLVLKKPDDVTLNRDPMNKK